MNSALAFWGRLKTPVSVRCAIRLKVLGTLLLFIAAFAVLYSGLSAPMPPAYRNSYRFEILIVAGITLIHLAYLRIVFDDCIIDKAVENITPADALFPFSLVGVYIFYGLHSLQYNRGFPSDAHQLEVSAYFLFIALYTAWLWRDWRIWLKHWRDGWETAIWFIVDFLSIAILGAYLLGWLVKGSFWLNETVTPKDWAAAICVGVWWMLRWFAGSVRRGNYRAEYAEYLSFNRAAKIQGRDVPPLGMEALSDVSVVDLGCGSGSRLVQLIEWMKASGHLSQNARISAVGYDRDYSWGHRFKAACRAADILPEFIASDIEALKQKVATAHVLLLSHVLYELPTWRFVAQLLKSCSEGSLVVARGTAARSFFSVVNLAYSRRFPSPTIGHLWRSHGLAYLIDTGTLKEVASCKVDQPYSLDSGGHAAARNLLNFLYGDGPAQLAGEYFDSLLKEKCTTVPNHDVLVFLKVVRTH